MKKFSTLAIGVIILILTLSVFTSLQAQTTTTFSPSFNTTPVIEGGGAPLAQGTKYRFSNVASGTSAVVTIQNFVGGATLNALDDNALTKPEAFSPRVNIPANSNGYVEFLIQFFNGNSNNPKSVDDLSVTAIDIDGNGVLKETDGLNLGANATLSFLQSTLEISVVQAGNYYTGTNIGGVEYTAVDTTAKQVMFTVTNSNITSFIYRAGANNTNGAVEGRQKSIYFKGFNYVIQGPLPVKYLSFDANVNEKSVLLNWVTEQEIDNNYFEVERSYTGNNFSKIAVVLDGFENGTKKVYGLKDNDALLQDSKVIYYRLKQFDKNGNFSYSNILVVRVKGASDISMIVSPNPFVDRVVARFTANEAGKAEIRISNLNGQTITAKNTTVNKGFNNIEVSNISTLASGTYIATLFMNGQIVGKQTIIK